MVLVGKKLKKNFASESQKIEKLSIGEILKSSRCGQMGKNSPPLNLNISSNSITSDRHLENFEF